MNPPEYKKVKEIFQEAIELPPDKRRAFLDEQCQANENLRFQVERLLKNQDASFMEEPLIAQMAEVVVKDEYDEDLANFLAECESNGYFSHYRIIKKIGAGGMGEVYLADDTRLNRKVAIKVLSKEFSCDEERLKRFIQEAKSVSALNHPNIITVFETREQKDIYYVVNEFVDGETLSKKIRKGRISLSDTIEIAVQIVSALAAAHEAGIIHRDIKPDNIMIRKDGIIKVLDFGLAKSTENPNQKIELTAETALRVNTTPGMIMGTPQYMSPEQAVGRKADVRSDIFSFGILLYELVSGKLPFEGRNPIEFFAAILKEKPTPIEQSAGESIPENLKRIIDKTLEKDPKDRYQDTKELLTDLKELRDELKFESRLTQEIHRTNSQKTTLTSEQIALQRKRFSYGLAALLFLLAGILAVSIWWLTSAAKTEQNFAGNPFSVQEIANWSSSPGELFSTAAFSPDGKTVAFSSTRSGKNSIWIRQINSGDAVQVTKDDFENKYPVFSPNGDEIAFVSNRDGENGIWRIPILGGQAKLLTSFKDAGAGLKFWSKSEKIYYEAEHNLFVFDTKTLETKKLTTFDSENESVHRIAVSADEKRIAYISNEDEKWKIFVKEINDAKPSEITTTENEINEIKWHTDGRRLLYSVLTGGNYQIFVLEADGKNKPVQVTFGEKDSVVQDISADGRKILFGSAQESSNLWYADVENAADKLFNADLNSEMWQDISPADETVVYQSIKNLSQANKLFHGAILAKKISADASPVRLADDGFLPKFSADGKMVAYLRSFGENTELWTVKSSGGTAQIIAKDGIEPVGFTLSPYNLIETAYYDWSPVSNQIAYAADRGDGANIRLAAADGSSDEKLTDFNDKDLLPYSPVWSPDGKKIAFYSVSNKPDSNGKSVRNFWIYNLETKETKKVFETNEIARLIGFSGNEQALIYASASKFSSLPPEVLLYAVSLENGGEKLLQTLKDAYFYNIRLSPDRTKIAYISRQNKIEDVRIAPTTGGTPKVLTKNNDPRLYFSQISWSPDGKKIFFGKQTRFTILSMIDDFR